MKRAVICVSDPWNYMQLYQDQYSLMILNPNASHARTQYLLDHADWSLFVTEQGEQHRDGGDYADEKALWYTSGTTGDSKFYSISWNKIQHVCQRLVTDYEITDNDRYVGIMPLWHAHGQMFYWLSKIVGFETTFLPMSKLTSIQEHDPTFVTAVPEALKLLLKLKFKSLRFVRSASSPLPGSLFHQLYDSLQVPVLEAFGMTEASSHCFTNPLNGEQKAGTVGLPSGIEAKIEQGKLWIQGPAVCSTGWFDTGDLAEQDHDGYYRILGRVSDTINIKGIKYNPVSLEKQLMANFEHLSECVIFGQDRVNCLYVGPADSASIKKFFLSLSPYLRAGVIEPVQSIPTNPMGKISRNFLCKEYL
jgi:acyl-coenzyme A synthetase/AMP-(fatty) acid ligase